MELGGKNAVIVLDDVDPVKAAADVATASFTASGQLCVSMERIYVLKGVADAFIPALAARVKAMKIGPAYDYSTDFGSLATAQQLENVMAHIDDATKKGATVLAGGVARPDIGPYFVEPTVLTDVTAEMKCSTAETFGPVVAVHVVDSEEAAIAAANDSEYGLNGAVFGRSRSRARRVANRMAFGTVNVNEGYRASFGSMDAPMGGVKHSGIGRRNGPEGLLRFAEAHTVADNTGLLQVPNSGAEWAKMISPMLLLLRIEKAIRRR
jgi:succinate-semialdehyde dehydrogenase/glutarate-semialdehyde dehydrogenase